MSLDASVRCDIRSGVAWITLTRPHRANALDGLSWKRLSELLLEAGSDPSVLLIAITGHGSAFCAGDDIHELLACTQDARLAQHVFYDGVRAAMEALIQVPKPTVAAVNGNAVGGGCEIVLLCDLAIAVETAKFAQPEARIGAWPAMFLVFGPEVLGAKAMNELALCGTFVDAEEALRLGLVNQVVPPQALTQAVEDYARLLGQNSPEATATILHYRRQPLRTRLPEFRASIEHFVDQTLPGPEIFEGLQAFIDKRQPRFAIGGGEPTQHRGITVSGPSGEQPAVVTHREPDRDRSL